MEHVGDPLGELRRSIVATSPTTGRRRRRSRRGGRRRAGSAPGRRPSCCSARARATGKPTRPVAPVTSTRQPAGAAAGARSRRHRGQPSGASLVRPSRTAAAAVSPRGSPAPRPGFPWRGRRRNAPASPASPRCPSRRPSAAASPGRNSPAAARAARARAAPPSMRGLDDRRQPGRLGLTCASSRSLKAGSTSRPNSSSDSQMCSWRFLPGLQDEDDLVDAGLLRSARGTRAPAPGVPMAPRRPVRSPAASLAPRRSWRSAVSTSGE